MDAAGKNAPRIVGRYALFGEIASGGMATVHIGRLLGPVRFSKTVAVKRLHPHFSKDADFVSMFLDEARIAGRIQHPNVVSTIDVVSVDEELFLVMEYVQGETLSRLLRASRVGGGRVPMLVATSIVVGALHGLQAAHDAKDERGEPLHIIHRDVSPQNIIVGVDGVPRVLDFGIAKAAARSQETRSGQFKGKVAYSAPEQLQGRKNVDRRIDIYGMGIVLWEVLAGRRCFVGDTDMELFGVVMAGVTEPPSSVSPDVPAAIDAIVMRALALNPDERYQTAREMAIALEDAVGLASPRTVGEWVDRMARAALTLRAERVQEIESVSQNLALLPHAMDALDGPASVRSSSGVVLTAVDLATSPSQVVTAPPPPSAATGGARRMFAAGLLAAAALGVVALVFFAVRPAPSASGSAALGSAASALGTLPAETAPAATATPPPAPSETATAPDASAAAAPASATAATAAAEVPPANRRRPGPMPGVAPKPPKPGTTAKAAPVAASTTFAPPVLER